MASKLVDLIKSLRGTKKAGRNRANSSVLSFDLLYQLSYMSVIASAGVPRDLIFERSSRIPGFPAEYFRKVEVTCRQLKYDYAKACRMVGEQAKEEEIKGLLLRFSNSLVSGEPEADFLAREAEAQGEAYHNEYGRKLETLKLWTDAYVSLILSAVLVIIVGIVSTMIWKIQTSVIVGLVMVAILTTVLGIWLIYLMSPRETVVLRKPGSREQKLAYQVFRMVAPLAIAGLALLVPLKANLGFGLLMAALAMLPIGLIAMIDDRKVTRRDAEVGAFLRSLGGVCEAVGTTVREALSRLDLDAVHNLRREVKRLHIRLFSGIKPRLCWKKFIEESGSELTNRSVGMFYDAIDLGGAPERAGYHSAIFASRVAMLRARRKTVTQPFQWLCIAMHASLVVLLVFITEVITLFGGVVTRASQSMPKIAGVPSVSAFASFNFAGLELMHSLVLPLVVVFTIANAFAPTLADGGSRLKMLYNLAITSSISGFALLFLPRLASGLFSNIRMRGGET